MIGSIFSAFTNIFKKPHTSSYPMQKSVLPPQYRGLIVHNPETCIWCDKCENVCPPGAILFFQNEDGSKVYDYNPWLCIYCGECIRACPKPDDALTQSELKQECATDDVNNEWYLYEAACKQARIDFKEAKKAAKKDKEES